jgi:hypothetical protein
MPSNEKDKILPTEEKLVEGLDFYFDGGLFVMTGHYLRKRGYCCKNGCRHCPYGYKKPADK